ncbi:hypothetical protein Dimus_027715 [Dionaea muscipula]
MGFNGFFFPCGFLWKFLSFSLVGFHGSFFESTGFHGSSWISLRCLSEGFLFVAHFLDLRLRFCDSDFQFCGDFRSEAAISQISLCCPLRFLFVAHLKFSSLPISQI